MQTEEDKKLAESNINVALALAVARHRLSMHALAEMLRFRLALFSTLESQNAFLILFLAGG